MSTDECVYKLVAPDIDRLVRYYDNHHGLMNPSSPSPELATAMDPLFEALSDLAPHPKNDEVKLIWLMVPRGDISDYGSFEEAKEYGEVETEEEFRQEWLDYYPDEICWYELAIFEVLNKENGSIRNRGIRVGKNFIVNADFEERFEKSSPWTEECALKLIPLLTEAAMKSMEMLRNGTYNDYVAKNLPFQHRTGVIKRNVLWDIMPELKENSTDELTPAIIQRYTNLIRSGANDENRVGRIKAFTANDFFHACFLGYKALGYSNKGWNDQELVTPVDYYIRYSDGRDEGLTGKGHGINEGPGIDFNDPKAWDDWFFGSHGGGHPWEIVPGGNSTHMALFVRNDKHTLDWKHRLGEISDEEYAAKLEKAGYFFDIAGKHRPKESVTFYVTLSDACLPVVIEDAEEILSRFEGTDYIGIVPHDVIPKYCESMFPEKYGRVIDFTHVYRDNAWMDKIEWLPEDESKLKEKAQ